MEFSTLSDNVKSVNIKSLLSECLTIASVSLEQLKADAIKTGQIHNVHLLTRLSHEVPKNFVLDPIRLNQIIMNLFRNSLAHTQRGFISLNARMVIVVKKQLKRLPNKIDYMIIKEEKTKGIQIEVKDTGSGISPERV
jgi:signal transduction histidine kinase